MSGTIPRLSDVDAAVVGWGRHFKMTLLVQYREGFFVSPLMITGNRTLGFDERSEMGQLSRVDPAPRAGRAQYARHSPLCPP